MAESKGQAGKDAAQASRIEDLQSAIDMIGTLLGEPSVSDTALEGTDDEWGGYSGQLPPQIELLDDGHGARLLASFAYTRPDGSEWPVPTGAWLDGLVVCGIEGR
jgi:hypothetical protein